MYKIHQIRRADIILEGWYYVTVNINGLPLISQALPTKTILERFSISFTEFKSYL